ncbi:MAG: [dimethylamine--corrinoid protein] Co-methyltransferase, partial [Deltaproteobacteria bacterium]|nr:[dimethylamine--corrinoid protein] Co-methyltransferase [Deltaproteobacteria bacterium]
MGNIVARMGDGDRVDMTEAEVQQDLETGTQDAADRAKISPLTSDEVEYLMELYRRKDRVVGVEDSKT